MTSLELDDIKYVSESNLDWNKFNNKTILISGGTGFIGSFFCNVIRYRNKKYNQNIKVISLSRHPLKNDDTVTYIKQDITKPIFIDGNVDFVLHLASNTHPEKYATEPVETITGNVFGTYYLLCLCKEKDVKKFLLASSCEIYGSGYDKPMDEEYCGYIKCNSARAGYNESKRVSEALCQSFYQENNVESVIVRLSRVFGADKTKKDSKVMSQFLNYALNGDDIIIKSSGNQKYSYIYIADAVLGIINVLLNGKSMEAYNLSSDEEPCSLKDYALYIAKIAKVNVIYKIEDNPNVSKAMDSILDISKIKSIGFKPKYGVLDGIKRTIDIFKGK